MAQVLSFPFRPGPNGTPAKVEQNSDIGEAEALAAHVLYRPGELELVPQFGMSDPTFSVFSEAELAAGAAAFGPQVEVKQVTSTPVDVSTSRVEVTFG